MKLLGVEAARGFAALLVVFVHAGDMAAGPPAFSAIAFGDIFHFAHAGVDFFFVLSGFIIFFVHADDIGHPARMASYAWKRFVRIYPTYWMALAGMGALLVVSPSRDGAERDVWHVISSIFLLPVHGEPLLGVAWSLKHEILFYFLFAVLFLNRRAGTAVLGLWGALIAWNIGVTWVTGGPAFGGLAGELVFRIFNIEFFFGIAVALLVRRGAVWSPRLMLVLGLLLFLGDGLYESWGPPHPVEWPPRHLGYGLGAALALYGMVGAERARRLRVPAAFVAAGTASYSIYLVHAMVIMVIQHAMVVAGGARFLNVHVWFIAVSAIAVACGLVFSALIEQPLLKALRRRRRLAVAE
jgi:exopolysaccharide production protein ExoZ